MTVSITFSHDDTVNGLWTGVGRPMTAYEIDLDLFNIKTAVETLQDNYTATISIEEVTQPAPSTMRVTLTDATFFDLSIPVGAFRDRGAWSAPNSYLVNDSFTAPNGGLYRVTFDHDVAGGTDFDPNANDGAGHDYYASMIPPRGNTLPDGGTTGQYYRKNSSVNFDANWAFIQAIEVVYSASTASTLTSDNVAEALEELDAKAVDLNTRVTTLEDHVVTATEVAFTPSTASGLVSTNVGDALEELAAGGGGGGGGGSVATLSDVAYATGDPIEGQLLRYNGTKWVPELLTKFTNLGNNISGTVTIDPSVDTIFKATPNGDLTINATGTWDTREITIVFYHFSGALCTVTFGTSFKTTGTLSVGSGTNDVTVIKFVTDGSQIFELCRSGTYT